MSTPAAAWSCALALNARREPIAGSAAELVAAISRGADLRIYTEFRHNEHIDVTSPSNELIQEVAQFGVTCVIDRRWVAGFMTLRQPVTLPDRFGDLPSLSLFLYNQDGHQAIARPYLRRTNLPAPQDVFQFPAMPGMHAGSIHERASNAPSMNFIYDFLAFRFCVLDRWTQVLAHDANGNVISGDVNALAEAINRGAHVKVAVSNLYDDLSGPGETPLGHEVMIECHSCYYYTQQRLMVAASQPLTRCRVAIPMQYQDRAWDYGWLVVRSDGHVVYRRCDPQTLAFTDRTLRCGLRWFVA